MWNCMRARVRLTALSRFRNYTLSGTCGGKKEKEKGGGDQVRLAQVTLLPDWLEHGEVEALPPLPRLLLLQSTGRMANCKAKSRCLGWNLISNDLLPLPWHFPPSSPYVSLSSLSSSFDASAGASRAAAAREQAAKGRALDLNSFASCSSSSSSSSVHPKCLNSSSSSLGLAR